MTGPVSPDRWLRRRRLSIGMLVLVIVALACYDHLRRERPGPGASAGASRDDIACFDGKTFRVVQTVDGDTIHIDLPDGKYPYTIVRLWGVDTPEVHGVRRAAYFGPEASKFTEQLAGGRQVRLELVPGRTRDRYGRLLAYVYLPDGGMLNERLVAEGYAYADTRFPHRLRAKFVRLEEQARTARAGLWAGVTIGDMPAWRQKRELQPNTSDSGAMLPAGPADGTFAFTVRIACDGRG
jgi:micrococcal nuclease